jgi:hypothetical protein
MTVANCPMLSVLLTGIFVHPHFGLRCKWRRIAGFTIVHVVKFKFTFVDAAIVEIFIVLPVPK